MRVWIKFGLVVIYLCAGSWGAGAAACELTGEFYQLGMQNTWVPWSKEFSTAEECQAAIGEADRHYYRNLHCEGCESANSQTRTSNTEPSQEPSSNEQAQQAAAEKERQFNLAKEQKFNDDKQDALSQLKGVAGDSEESANEKGDEPVSRKLEGPRESSRKNSGGGLDRASGRNKPKEVRIPPASDPKLEILKKQIKQYKTDLEKKKKKIQELNTKITLVAVQQNEAADREAESAPATYSPGAPEAKPTQAPKTDDSAAKKLAELNALRQAAMADQADLEKKISVSEKQVDKMSKPTPIP